MKSSLGTVASASSRLWNDFVDRSPPATSTTTGRSAVEITLIIPDHACKRKGSDGWVGEPVNAEFTRRIQPVDRSMK
jgi:hypothetical protein